MPEARELIGAAGFDADTVRWMGEIFDAAWALIEHAFQDQSQSTLDMARSTLAKAIIDHVSLGSRDRDVIKDRSIRMVKLTFQSLPV